ncbi:dehydrogenase [Dyadobacter endophyticus]|uniref:Dehydrogenase n=1 Tax=Dyadobacter endophyticus TaxID=1749036 RepID=A0ABQ1YDI3_9BACT|nr:SDR family oxidoreductase [Dyadobacter endophyticus]GGH20935.1 dehydrogenase [Dyadobacter endophyticus]
MNRDQVVLITGATGGIGRATAWAFASVGCKLVLTDTDPSQLSALEEELKAGHYQQVLSLPGDLAETGFWDELIGNAFAKWGIVDVLVNNAAWRTIETMRTIPVETWEKTLRICLTAPAFLSRAVAGRTEALKRPAVIVNVSSMMADRPAGTSPAYIASKGALDSLTAELAVTYGRSGVRVVGVSPGYVETALSRDYQDADGDNVSTRLIDAVNDNIPLGRGASPEEIAAAICWLTSEGASYITGTTLVIDGGFKPNFSGYSVKRNQFPDQF